MLSSEDQEALSAALEGAWSDPLCACFCELELDLGEGRQPVHALYGGKDGSWLVRCLVDKSQMGEEAIQALLTRRQREIMEWIAEGKTSAEAAIILDISPRTVEKHLEAIFHRFGVENRITAVRRYLEMKSGQFV
jgi:DNA-binding CsgD family transcriptional regulator